MNKEELIEAYINLEEGFRDIDRDIEELEDELYDLISSVEVYNNIDNILDYEFSEEDFYEEDIQKGHELQQEIKELYQKRKEEYLNEIKDLPKETTKTEFEGFDITETDPPFPSYMMKGSKDREYYMNKYGYDEVYIAEMTPEEYLLLCGKYGWKSNFTDIETIYNNSGTNKELVHEYAQMFREGKKAPIPVLDLKKLTQEGRHRAFACIEVGIKTIPVLIMI